MHILLPYQFVAINQHHGKNIHVFVNRLIEEPISESTNVICIDLIKQRVYDFAPLGSYLNEVGSVRLIDPEFDDMGSLYRQISFFPDMQKIHLNRLLKGRVVPDEGFLKYYRLDNGMFDGVKRRFEDNGLVDHVDIMSILFWKSLKSKSVVTKKLIIRFGSLEDAARSISMYLSNPNVTDYQRFVYLTKMGLKLQAVTAILTVLFPERFIMYSTSIHELPEFKNFMRLDYIPADLEFYWEMYRAYISEVIWNTPAQLSLRQKKQYLFGKLHAGEMGKMGKVDKAEKMGRVGRMVSTK